MSVTLTCVRSLVVGAASIRARWTTLALSVSREPPGLVAAQQTCGLNPSGCSRLLALACSLLDTVVTERLVDAVLDDAPVDAAP
jgi:hypothetical protein